MIRYLLILSALFASAYAQKGDRLIQVPRWSGYLVSFAGLDLPRGAVLVGVHISSMNADALGVDALPQGWVASVSQTTDGADLYLFPAVKTKIRRMSEVLQEFDRLSVVYPKQIDDPAPTPDVCVSLDFYGDKSGELTRWKVSSFKLNGDVLVPNQPLEPTALASTPRADARVAPAKAVAHH